MKQPPKVTNKLTIGYTLASMIVGITFILAMWLLAKFDHHIRVSVDIMPYFKVLLSFALLGLIISFLLLILRKWASQWWAELLICLVIRSAAIGMVSLTVQTSMEGIWVLFTLAGLLIGLMVFGIYRVIRGWL
jgi:hypothetical protein